MQIRWNRIETWLALGVLGIGVILLGVGGLFIYMSATATPLHSDADAISAITDTEPAQKWSAAVERARQGARADIAEKNLPGMSVAVGIDGQIVWAEGFGWANVDKQERVTPGTRFRIGTASIPLTAAAAGLLIERGQLKLDDEIPDFPKKPWRVTLRQVMAHTAGLASDGGDEGPLFGQRCERPADAFPHFADRELRFEPDTEYRYSRFGFIAVSAAIETASDQPFLAFMQKHIFTPLGMDDTLADSDTETIQDRALSYFPKFASDPRYGNDVMRDLSLSCYAGSSVFLSTASDLVRFGLGISGGKLLKPETVQLLQTTQRLKNGEETGYGLGWDIETVTLAGTPMRSVGHDGDLLGGIAVSFMTLPDRGLVVAVLSNTSYADTPAIATKIAAAFIDGQSSSVR
jgi:serine beta-lactamase-like protein LACTB